MRRVTVQIWWNGKLVRTVQEYFLGPVGNRATAVKTAVAAVKARLDRSGMWPNAELRPIRY